MQDCVLGAIWVNIMRARFIRARVKADVIPRMNIAVTSAAMARRPRGLTDQHFGNSTIPTVAICGPGLTDFEGDVQFKDYTIAAQQIRKALDQVTPKYIQELTTVKRKTAGTNNRDAYNGVLGAESLAFEDWTSLGGGREVYIPHAQDDRPCFLPCGEDMREGQIILLPRKGSYWSKEPWRISICLTEEDMETMLEDLDVLGFTV